MRFSIVAALALASAVVALPTEAVDASSLATTDAGVADVYTEVADTDATPDADAGPRGKGGNGGNRGGARPAPPRNNNNNRPKPAPRPQQPARNNPKPNRPAPRPAQPARGNDRPRGGNNPRPSPPRGGNRPNNPPRPNNGGNRDGGRRGGVARPRPKNIDRPRKPHREPDRKRPPPRFDPARDNGGIIIAPPSWAPPPPLPTFGYDGPADYWVPFWDNSAGVWDLPPIPPPGPYLNGNPCDDSYYYDWPEYYDYYCSYVGPNDPLSGFLGGLLGGLADAAGAGLSNLIGAGSAGIANAIAGGIAGGVPVGPVDPSYPIADPSLGYDPNAPPPFDPSAPPYDPSAPPFDPNAPVYAAAPAPAYGGAPDGSSPFADGSPLPPVDPALLNGAPSDPSAYPVFAPGGDNPDSPVTPIGAKQ